MIGRVKWFGYPSIPSFDADLEILAQCTYLSPLHGQFAIKTFSAPALLLG